MINGYSMGGPLILPGIRPYIDGRGDMYGDELVVGYARITHGDAGRIGRSREALEHPLGDRAQSRQRTGRAAAMSPSGG